jgi:hypothetical protein
VEEEENDQMTYVFSLALHPNMKAAQVRTQLLQWSALYMLQLVVFLIVLLMAIHITNVYPRHYGPALAERDDAVEFVRACENPVIRYSKHASCADALAHASANVRLVALERTLHECLGHFNFIGALLGDARVSYVLLRCVDNLMSSSLLLLLVLIACAMWLVWTWSVGPLRYYYRYAMLQEQQLPHTMGGVVSLAMPDAVNRRSGLLHDE